MLLLHRFLHLLGAIHLNVGLWTRIENALVHHHDKRLDALVCRKRFAHRRQHIRQQRRSVEIFDNIASRRRLLLLCGGAWHKVFVWLAVLVIVVIIVAAVVAGAMYIIKAVHTDTSVFDAETSVCNRAAAIALLCFRNKLILTVAGEFRDGAYGLCEMRSKDFVFDFRLARHYSFFFF